MLISSFSLNLKKGCHGYSLVLFIPLHTSICLFVLFIAIALSAFTTSDYPFSIFKFSHIYYCSVTWDVPKNVSTLVENIGYSRMNTTLFFIFNSRKHWIDNRFFNKSPAFAWEQIKPSLLVDLFLYSYQGSKINTVWIIN